MQTFIPQEHFRSLFILPHCVTAPCPIPAHGYTRAGQEAALDTLVYAPVTPCLRRAYAKQPGPGSFSSATNCSSTRRTPSQEPSEHNWHEHLHAWVQQLESAWSFSPSVLPWTSLVQLAWKCFYQQLDKFLKGPRSHSSSLRQGSVILSLTGNWNTPGLVLGSTTSPVETAEQQWWA